MDIIAHGLWAAAAVSGKRTLAGKALPRRAIVLWAMFPDLLAFGPSAIVALWLEITGGADGWSVHRGHFPHVEFGLPLYESAHSLVVFAGVFAVCSLALRRPIPGMLGWLLHILVDIPTHSARFYATRFAWPVAAWRVDGIAWRTPWFFVCTYAALAAVYLFLWKTGRLSASWPPAASSRTRSSRPAPDTGLRILPPRR